MSSNIKDIKKRIKAVTNTKKVTSSMKLLSQIKLQQLNKAIRNSRLYTEKLLSMTRKVITMLDEVEENNLLYLFNKHDSSKVIYLVGISADRGLCGGFNTYMFKALHARVLELAKEGFTIKLVLIGKKIIKYAQKYLPDQEIVHKFENSSCENKNLGELLSNLYKDQKPHSIELLYTHFISSLKSHNTTLDLLPLNKDANFSLDELSSGDIDNQDSQTNIKQDQEILIEPSPTEILHKLLPIYIQNKLIFALLNSRASEMSNRVTAMTAATDNAKSLIKDLTLVFNKVRQANITQEISEIVVGMESMSEK